MYAIEGTQVTNDLPWWTWWRKGVEIRLRGSDGQ